MSKIAVVYVTVTGNTEVMANKIAEGAKAAQHDVYLSTCAEFDTSTTNTFDIVVLGCPACGSEELDEAEFIPMFETIKDDLKSKKVALFGSYGWGGGEYMEMFKEKIAADGIHVIMDVLTVENAPDDEAQEACFEFGKLLN